MWIGSGIGACKWAHVGDAEDSRVLVEVGNESSLVLEACFIATEDDAKLWLKLETHVDDLMRHVGCLVVMDVV